MNAPAGVPLRTGPVTLGRLTNDDQLALAAVKNVARLDAASTPEEVDAAMGWLQWWASSSLPLRYLESLRRMTRRVLKELAANGVRGTRRWGEP